MSWGIEYIPQAAEDFDKPDGSQKKLVLKALNKVAQNPLPDCEGGYGKDLSFRMWKHSHHRNREKSKHIVRNVEQYIVQYMQYMYNIADRR